MFHQKITLGGLFDTLYSVYQSNCRFLNAAFLGASFFTHFSYCILCDLSKQLCIGYGRMAESRLEGHWFFIRSVRTLRSA